MEKWGLAANTFKNFKDSVVSRDRWFFYSVTAAVFVPKEPK